MLLHGQIFARFSTISPNKLSLHGWMQINIQLRKGLIQGWPDCKWHMIDNTEQQSTVLWLSAGQLSQEAHDDIFNDCYKDRYFALLRLLQNLGLLTNAESGSVKQTMWRPQQGLLLYHVVLATHGRIEVREVCNLPQSSSFAPEVAQGVSLGYAGFTV